MDLGNVESCFLHEMCSYRGGKHDLIDIIKDCTAVCPFFSRDACTFNVCVFFFFFFFGLSKGLLITLVVWRAELLSLCDSPTIS